MNAWHTIGRQLQHPEGRAGRVVGHAMRWLNTKPNAVAIAALDIAPSDHILELGFGPGQALAQLARRVPMGRVYGVDASQTMLVQALRRNRRAVEAGTMSLWLGEFAPLPLPDAAVDKILAVNVAYFWRDPAAILAECHRVLRPGGRIAIYATDAATMQHWKFADRDTHVLCTADALHDALLGGGFAQENVRIETMTLPAGIQGILAIGRKSTILSLT